MHSSARGISWNRFWSGLSAVIVKTLGPLMIPSGSLEFLSVLDGFLGLYVRFLRVPCVSLRFLKVLLDTLCFPMVPQGSLRFLRVPKGSLWGP